MNLHNTIDLTERILVSESAILTILAAELRVQNFIESAYTRKCTHIINLMSVELSIRW